MHEGPLALRLRLGSASMSKLVEIDGFYLEIKGDDVELLSAADGPRTTKTGGADAAAQAAGELAQAAAKTQGTIAKVCETVLGAFEAANRPDELKVKFGLKLSAKVGVPYVTEGAGEAAIEIEATWKNNEASSSGPSDGQ